MTDWRMSSATDMEEKHAALVSCCWTASSSAFCSAVRKSCSRAEVPSASERGGLSLEATHGRGHVDELLRAQLPADQVLAQRGRLGRPEVLVQ